MEKFTRRDALRLAGCLWIGSAPLFASESEFWNKKEPSEWTAEEQGKILNKSPWAKEVTAQFAPGEGQNGGYGGGGGYPGGGGGGYPGGGGMGGPRIGIGGIGFPGGGRMGRGGGRGRGGSQASNYKGVIRWETAQPVREADKSKLPDSFKDHYVISISGIPLMNGGRRSAGYGGDDSQSSQQDQFDRLKQFTTLQPKGKAIAQPGVVEQQGGTYLFGFSKDSLQLSADDKEFDFASRLGSLIVKTKFIAKEMKYRGKLAI